MHRARLEAQGTNLVLAESDIRRTIESIEDIDGDALIASLSVTKDDLTGKLARLPDRQEVKIELVHPNGYAFVRRTDGE
jgi:hypothetical protein